MDFNSVLAAVPAVIGVTDARRFTPSEPAGCPSLAIPRGSKATAGGLLCPFIAHSRSPVESALAALSGGLPLLMQPAVQFRVDLSLRTRGSIELSVKRFSLNGLAHASGHLAAAFLNHSTKVFLSAVFQFCTLALLPISISKHGVFQNGNRTALTIVVHLLLIG